MNLPSNLPQRTSRGQLLQNFLPTSLGLLLLLLSLFQPKALAPLTLLWFLSQPPIAKRNVDGSSS